MTKRKFSKLLNKEVKYTAVLKQISNDTGSRVMIQNVMYGNKLYSDHSWIKSSITTEKIPYNSKISFEATAYMYNDKFGIRKQGLKSCKNFEIINEDYTEQQDKETHDNFHYRKRKGKL